MCFNPDGTRFLTGDTLGNGQLWDAPPPPWDGDDETIRLQVQVATGLELDDRQRLQVWSRADWEERRSRLSARDSSTRSK